MDRRPWLERMDAELMRCGVSASARRQFLAEVRDHLEDLHEGDTNMTSTILEERLGEPEALAHFAAEQYRQATWTHRHPFLVFGLLPAPVWLLMCFSMVAAMVGVAYAMKFYTGTPEMPRWVNVAGAYSLVYALRFVPFLVVMAVFTHRYLRSGVHRGWYLIAVAQILVAAATFNSGILVSEIPGQSQITIGFSLNSWFGSEGEFWSRVGWMQLLQLALPIGLGFLMLRLAHRQKPDLVTG